MVSVARQRKFRVLPRRTKMASIHSVRATKCRQHGESASGAKKPLVISLAFYAGGSPKVHTWSVSFASIAGTARIALWILMKLW
jgi:hypothetical protein